MDTKLKSIRGRKFLRGILFVLIILMLGQTLLLGRDFIENVGNNIEIITESNFSSSDKFNIDRGNIIDTFSQLVIEYKSEEHIKKGGTITYQDILSSEYTPYYSEFVDTEKFDPDKTEYENYLVFKENYKEEVAKAKKQLIDRDLRTYARLEANVNKMKNIDYYATNGKDVFTNRENLKKEDFQKYKGYYIYDIDGANYYPSSRYSNNHWSFISEEANDDTKIYIGFTDKYFEVLEKEWVKEKEITLHYFKKFIVAFLFMIFLFIVEVALLPSMEEEGERFIDRPFTDISISICMILLAIEVVFLQENIVEKIDGYLASVTIGLGAIGLFFTLSLVRNLKNKRFFRHSLIGKIFIGIKNFFVEIYRGRSSEKKVLFLTIIYPILVAISLFFAPITILLVSILVFRKAKDFTKIREGVRKVKNGDLGHKIEIAKKGEFKDLAEDINSISDGLDQAIDNELKSERLKSELITNVSHDIRTPLTSIITYIDLLKNEDDEAKKEEYIKVLDAKAHRLKSLTDDLFEASKVSSGNIPVNLRRIDIVSLIKQGLGEMSDKIESNQLEFIVESEVEEIFVYADGDLLWRAIENLLSNIFKYSLKNSRVYIDLRKRDDRIYLSIKNISAYKLNITSEELMERFKRGDESRTSEGSGLGLSIVESLIELQKGRFRLDIDGDLFKTTIDLPEYRE